MSHLDHGRTQGRHNGAALAAERSDHARPRAFRLDSAYLARALPLSPDAPGAHTVSLLVDGWLGQEAVRAILIADPNVCTLDDLGDRTACTRLAPRSYAVALTRLRAGDPASSGRRLFAITGADMPDGLTLVMYPHGDRAYMLLGDDIVWLHHDDGAHR